MITIMLEPVVEQLLALARREQLLGKGRLLFRAGDPVLSLFVVVRGELRLVRALPHGAQLTLQRAGPGAVLAEASIFAARYHCDAIVSERSAMRVVPLPALKTALREDAELALAFLRHLAREVQHSRAQAETLSLKTVAERVDAWLALNGGTLPEKGQWRRVAGETGITPEALYRELARRRPKVARLRQSNLRKKVRATGG